MFSPSILCIFIFTGATEEKQHHYALRLLENAKICPSDRKLSERCLETTFLVLQTYILFGFFKERLIKREFNSSKAFIYINSKKMTK